MICQNKNHLKYLKFYFLRKDIISIDIARHRTLMLKLLFWHRMLVCINIYIQSASKHFFFKVIIYHWSFKIGTDTFSSILFSRSTMKYKHHHVNFYHFFIKQRQNISIPDMLSTEHLQHHWCSVVKFHARHSYLCLTARLQYFHW